MSDGYADELLEGEGAEQEYLQRAFELAYFIHANVGVALSITEAAWCKLPHTFGKQDRRYRYIPSGRRQSQERSSYPLRTKVSLRKEHLLQLLVFAESDSWERSTELGNSAYALTNEDMVIRFLKHLVQLTLKRSSFYVALGLGRLLYNYQTSQVSQIYDILMQDHARFRENSYLRKQKKLLIEEISDRFDHMIRLVKTAQGEYRFVTQATTQPLIDLVNQCLRRYTPWGTTCVVPATFDPAQSIAALSFMSTNPDMESSAEMNRIHTVLHPDCFSRLVAGLGLEPPERCLAVPRFFFFDNEPQGDRFNPPPLAPEQQRQIQRAREGSARRRKSCSVGKLRIYVDDVENLAFDPRIEANVAFTFGPQVNVIEVRGHDSEGELPLATLLVSYEDIPEGESLSDSVILEGGQKLTILLTPIRETNGETKELCAEIKYTETNPMRAIWRVAQRAYSEVLGRPRSQSGVYELLRSGYSLPLKVGLTVTLVLSGLIVILIIWQRQQPAQLDIPVVRHGELRPPPTTEFSPPTSPTPAPARSERAQASLIARAEWNSDPNAADEAIRIDARRGDVRTFEIPLRQTNLLIAVNRADPQDQAYSQYHIMLTVGEKTLWKRKLQAPRTDHGHRAHVMSFEISPQRFPSSDAYRLRVEGQAQGRWQLIGDLMLRPVSR